ncbi:hypothetical protein LEN26_016735 [Aphanomyces euteiches]|nr:hypothetical protein LEN26_016735 [Aphanomyces euteiches]
MVHDIGEGGMQACGCAVGRPCTCGYSMRKTEDNSTNITVDEDELIEVSSGVALRLKKKYFEEVSGTRLYRLMHQYRLSLRDAVVELTEIITEAQAHKKVIAFELVEIANRKARLTGDGLKPPSKREIQENSYMASAYSDMNPNLKTRPPGFVASALPVAIQVLEPHLTHLQTILTEAIQKARANLLGCKNFVFNYASSRIQCVVRGGFDRARFVSSLILFWCGAETAAVVTLQCFFRKAWANTRVAILRAEHHRRICWHASIQVQRTMRGFFGRQRAETRRRDFRYRLQNAAAVTLQCWVRCIAATRIVKVRRQLAAAQRERNRQECALRLIQRVYRGHRGRTIAKHRRIERSLCPQVQALVDQFKASGGDIWALLKIVDSDYREFNRMAQLEEENATTFVTKVLWERQRHQEEALQKWHVSRALESPVVSHQRRIDSAYERGSRDEFKSTPKVIPPTSLFEPSASRDSIHLNQIAPETLDIHDKYAPGVIRQAMAQGFAVPEILAALRGLEARRKSTRNIKLLLRELHRRTPLMLHPFKSERIHRQQQLPRQNLDIKDIRKCYDILSPSSDDNAPLDDDISPVAQDLVDNYILRAVPDGLDTPISSFVFAAGMLVYVPPLLDFDGESTQLSTSWTTTPNSHFIRREQLVSEAIAPIIELLKAQHVVHGGDLDRTTPAQLNTWHIPSGLSHSLLALVATCRKVQRATVGYSRRIMRPRHSRLEFARKDGCASNTSTPDTIVYDSNGLVTTPPAEKSSNGLEDKMLRFADMKARIEATAFTPMTLSSSLFDLLFQAVFVVLPEEDHAMPSDANLDVFIHRLLDTDLSMHATHRLLKRRSQRTATLARTYANALKAGGCFTVQDIVNRPSLRDFSIPDVVAEQIITHGAEFSNKCTIEIIPTHVTAKIVAVGAIVKSGLTIGIPWETGPPGNS